MGTKTNPDRYIGKVYGRLTVEAAVYTKPKIAKDKQYGYIYGLLCSCSCGNKKVIAHVDLTSGHTRSCGCFKSEETSKRNYKHGLTYTPAWRSWNSMTDRCYSPSSSAYYKYGAEGITICDRWRGSNGFNNFIADMGERPEGHSIDRIDGSKGYFPENCRWADAYQQSNNQKSNVKVTYKGRVYNVSQLMRKFGVYTKAGTYYGRLSRGWDVEMAMKTPIRKRKSR